MLKLKDKSNCFVVLVQPNGSIEEATLTGKIVYKNIDDYRKFKNIKDTDKIISITLDSEN